MKKIFLIQLLAIILVLLLVVNVHAITFETNVPYAKVGDIITLTIKRNTPSRNLSFNLSYDNSRFEYVNDSVKFNSKNPSELNIINSTKDNDGSLFIGAVTLDAQPTLETISVQFKVKGDKVTEPISMLFNLVNNNPEDEEIVSPSINLEVVQDDYKPNDDTQENIPSVTPTPDNETPDNENTNTESDNKSNQNDETVNTKDESPKTGFANLSFYAFIVSLISFVGIVFVKLTHKDI